MSESPWKPPINAAPPVTRRAKGKRHDPRELQLPLMTSLQPREKRGR